MELFQKIGSIVIVVLLMAYVITWVSGVQETHDAKLVEATQVSLQQALSQGISALQLPPNKIDPQNIINSARSSFHKDVVLDKNFHMTLRHSSREAQFQISDQGDMRISSLTNFHRYHIEDGRIVRNNHWFFQVLPQ